MVGTVGSRGSIPLPTTNQLNINVMNKLVLMSILKEGGESWENDKEFFPWLIIKDLTMTKIMKNLSLWKPLMILLMERKKVN